WFGTRTSKSRLNFLDLLRAGHTDFVLNAAAFDYMRERALSATLIARLAEQPQTTFADQAAWSAQLDRLGFTGLTITPDPVQIATEGAIWGSTKAHGFACDAVVLSDDAGQFAVGQHALCWVHAERLVHKLDTFTDLRRAAQEARPRPDLVVLCRSQGLFRGSDHTASQRDACTFRPHLPPPHRVRHPRSPARAVACEQVRVAHGARTAGDSAAHQWLRP